MELSRVRAPGGGLGVARRNRLLRPVPRRLPVLRSAAVGLNPAVQPPSDNGDIAAHLVPQGQHVLRRMQPSWWHLDPPTPEGPAAAETTAENSARTPLLPLVGKILRLVAPDKLMLAVASVFMVSAALAELAIPHFATSCIFSAAAAGATHASFQSKLTLLASIIVFYGIMSALRGYCFSILNNRMTMRLRMQLFSNLVRRDTGFFDGTDTGSLTSRLQADCQAMTKCVATNLNIAFRNCLQAVGGVAYLAVTSPVMCGATLGVCAILWSITLIYGEYARRTQKIFQDTLACGNQVAEEVLSLNRLVRTFGTEGREVQRYGGWLGRLYNVGLRQATGYGLFVASGHIACYMTKVVALTLGCAMLVQGTLTAEQLTNFIFYVEFVTYASLSACDEVVEVMEAVGASERVLNLLEGPAAAQVAAGATPDTFTGHVEFRDVSFHYPARPGHAALTGINLELRPGQLVALVGLSGSGKTTLVALLQRLYDPVSGAILVDGHDLTQLDAGWYRSHIGVVSQEPRLFGTSIADNIAYGCPFAATREDVEDAARQANAHEFIMALPQGYDTRVTDKLLSGGQKQRIALARALVRRPGLLILDEATSALDAESEAAVQAALDTAMRAGHRTVIVIAHRLSTVRNADVTVVMDKGTIVERGTHESLLRKHGIYARLVARQQHGAKDLSPPAEEVDGGLLPAGSAAHAAAVGVTANGVSGNGASPAAGGVYTNGAAVLGAAGVATNGNGQHPSNGHNSGVAHMMATREDGGTIDEDGKLQGTSSGDESGALVPSSPGSLPGLASSAGGSSADLTLLVTAAAAVTAENELSSKVLGSQDPIDYLSGQ